MAKRLLYVSRILILPIIAASLCSLTRPSSAIGDPLNPFIYVAPLVYVADRTGETFDIDINISNVNNLHSVEFKLSYDASLLDAIEVVQGSFFPYPPQSFVALEIDKTAGFIWTSIIIESESGQSGNGTLVRITFNITVGAKCSYSILHLEDTSLYDNSMAPISHSSIDGLYFWMSLLPDPPPPGRLLDLATQKGGIGPNETGGTFYSGEMVELYSCVTYNNDPVQQIIVAFQVIEPIGSTALIRTSRTDQTRCTNISFRIASLPESYGLWTAVSVASIADETVWDIVQFQCVPSPVGGFSESVNMPSSSHMRTRTYYVILVVVIASIFIWIKQKMRKSISSSRNMGNSLILCGEKGK